MFGDGGTQVVEPDKDDIAPDGGSVFMRGDGGSVGIEGWGGDISSECW
jgi:hypothetical protein